MKVRVIKASANNYWYANRVGDEFVVISKNNYSYTVNKEEEEERSGGILIEDCRVVQDESEAVNVKSLKEIVKQLRSCGFTCEAGPLVNNADFQLLEQIAGVKSPLKELVERRRDDLIAVAVENARQYNAQAARDEIIEKAKRDVAELKYSSRSFEYQRQAFGLNAEFIVNKEKRTVVALMHGYMDDRVLFKGIAKADPTDCFNVHIGKAIALRRALGLEVPAEYLNAPQPTEVRVGDVVEGTYADDSTKYRETVGVISGGRYDYISGYYDLTTSELKVIDDSREDVAK